MQKQEGGAQNDARTVEKERFCPRYLHHRQTAILRCCSEGFGPCQASWFWWQEEQPGGEFSLASPTTRTTNATFQIASISAAVFLYPRYRLQHLQRPTSSDFPKNIAPVSQPSNRACGKPPPLPLEQDFCAKFTARPFNNVATSMKHSLSRGPRKSSHPQMTAIHTAKITVTGHLVHSVPRHHNAKSPSVTSIVDKRGMYFNGIGER